jgi:DNA-binding IscR family transcriptional regulator
LVESRRGASGGYTLSRAAEDISLGDVIGALEGRPSLTSCAQVALFQTGTCEVEPVCPIRSPIQRIRLGLWAMLERTTLRDMSHHTLEGALAGATAASGLAETLAVVHAEPPTSHPSPTP